MFDQRPFKVITKKGNAVVIERDGVQYKRNISCLKKVRDGFGLENGSTTGS